jgi:hypothetical protein
MVVSFFLFVLFDANKEYNQGEGHALKRIIWALKSAFVIHGVGLSF